MTLRRLTLATILLAVVMAGCGQESPPSVVSGEAAPCLGVATPSAYAATAVTVTLSKGAQVVASEVVHGRSPYRLTAPAGRYLLSANRSYPSVPVILLPGRVSHVALIPSCK